LLKYVGGVRLGSARIGRAVLVRCLEVNLGIVGLKGCYWEARSEKSFPSVTYSCRDRNIFTHFFEPADVDWY